MKKINILLVAASLLVGSLVSCGDETPKEPETPQIPEKPVDPTPTPTPEPVKKVDYKKYNIEEITLEDKIEETDKEFDIHIEEKEIIVPEGSLKVNLEGATLPDFLIPLTNADGYLGLYNVIAQKYIYAPQIDISKAKDLVSPFEIYDSRDEFLIKIDEGEKTLFIDYIGNLIYECKTKDAQNVKFEITIETRDHLRTEVYNLSVGEETIRFVYEKGEPVIVKKESVFFDNEKSLIPLDHEGYPGYSYFITPDGLMKIYKDGEIIKEYPLKIDGDSNTGDTASGKLVYVATKELGLTNYDYDYRVFDEDDEIDYHIKEDVYQIDILTGEQKELSFDPNYAIEYISPIKNDEGIFDAFIVEAYRIDDKVLNESAVKLFICDVDLNIIEDVTNAKEISCAKFGEVYIDRFTDKIYDKDFNEISFKTPVYFRDYIFSRDLLVLENSMTEYVGLYKANGEELLPQIYEHIAIKEGSDVAIAISKNKTCSVISLDTLEVLKGPFHFDEYELDDYDFPTMVALMRQTEYEPEVKIITSDGEVNELIDLENLRVPITSIANNKFTGLAIIYLPFTNQVPTFTRIYSEEVEFKTVGKEVHRYEYDGTNSCQALPLALGENKIIKANEEPNLDRTLQFTPTKSGFYDITGIGTYLDDVYTIYNGEYNYCDKNGIDKTIYLEKDCRYYFDINIEEDVTFDFKFIRDIEVYDGTKLENLFVTDTKKSFFTFECHETGSYYFEIENAELFDICTSKGGALLNAIAGEDYVDGQERLILFEGMTYFFKLIPLEDKVPSILYSNILDFNLENYLKYDEKVITKNDDGSYTYLQKAPANEELIFCELPDAGLFYIEFDISINAPEGEFILEHPEDMIHLTGRQVKHIKTVIYDGFIIGFDCENDEFVDVGFTISNLKMSGPIIPAI